MSGVPEEELRVECESLEDISTTTHTATISRELAGSLEEVLLLALKGNSPRKRAGKDGTVHHFISSWHSGQIWMPPENSVAQVLVEIGELLAAYTTESEPNREQLMNEIEQRVDLLKKNIGEQCYNQGV